MEENVVQDAFLSSMKDKRIPVSVFLINGIRLYGDIKNFDANVIILEGNIKQKIYKHAIATIVPDYEK